MMMNGILILTTQKNMLLALKFSYRHLAASGRVDQRRHTVVETEISDIRRYSVMGLAILQTNYGRLFLGRQYFLLYLLQNSPQQQTGSVKHQFIELYSTNVSIVPEWTHNHSLRLIKDDLP